MIIPRSFRSTSDSRFSAFTAWLDEAKGDLDLERKDHGTI